ncbi:MAG: hypothetical protein E6J71_13340 [Deltaproteobacteria bacterium]|nr:MAG: hypothetical protein E6J81_13445 [Deltaproteobacteria bacterium]TMA83569.1 MAG: hypothetical protein E6J77_14115 [Deltaproteobacteria bacterium]TMB17993.1 MAG: hypothetical protein E6J71_13340 [Deltaproteobacteria bacterium]
MPSPSRRRLTAGEQVVRDALRRRGLSWNGERDPTPLLVPTGAARLRHYALLGHYSYRLFLRDVLRRPTDLRATALTRYTTAAVAARYLRFLAAARLVEPSGRGRYRLRERRIVSFGGTLEWYVAEVFAREFGCAAAAGLRLHGAPHGGDYDVVACAEGEVLYVETKSAPPRQIVESEVRAFLDRVDTLRPDCALFLADTTLRMRDKLVGLFAAEVTRRRLAWDESARIERELWRVGPEIYLLNSDPDLVRNMGVCLAVHFRGRGVAVG